jgi:hypothetical protein
MIDTHFPVKQQNSSRTQMVSWQALIAHKSELEPVINAGATVSDLDGSTRGLLGYVDMWKDE